MNDVAAAARVSLKTVSRVVNHAPNVHPELADRVRRAMAELGFRRNDLAATLRAGRSTKTLGLVIEDLTNPFYATLASGVAKVARQHDSLLITSSLEEARGREPEFIYQLCERRVDGLLIVPAGTNHAFLKAEMDMGLPVVFLDRPPIGLRADTVLVDNQGGATAGMQRLLSHGHARLAILLDSLAIYTMQERLAGARTALASAGVRDGAVMLRVDLHDPAEAARTADELLNLDAPPTAFFCGNNRIAVGVIGSLARRGSEAEVVAFDDFELSHSVPVNLSVVAYDIFELGRIGAELLFRRIEGESGGPQAIVVPTTILERGLRIDEQPLS